MSELVVSRQELRIGELLELRSQLRLDPDYQRGGGIWSRERQQLFIDSVLNGFDVPPLYFHRLRPPELADGSSFMYAVIDGRQRLETIWDFADSAFPLSNDFRFYAEEPHYAADEQDTAPTGRHEGLTFADLRAQKSILYFRFVDYSMPTSIIDTDDVGLIEELFFRLNEGVALTPAEKRNRGTLLREQLAPLVDERDLFRIARFRRRRRNYEDLLLRLLFMEASGVTRAFVPDMKKRQLDEFAASFRPSFGETWSAGQEATARARLSQLVLGVVPTVEAMESVFRTEDSLLSTITSFLVYYLAFRELIREALALPDRLHLEQFNERVNLFRGIPEDQLTDEQLELMEFGQPIQGSTTGSYFQRRVELLLRSLANAIPPPPGRP